MRSPDAFEPLLRARRFLAVRRDLDDALPRLRGAFEILLAPGADDADVQQRLRVLGIDRQRLLELLQRAVGLIGVVVGDPEVGADVDVLRIDLERRLIPAGGFVEALAVEVQVAELRPRRGVRGPLVGLRLELRDPVLVEGRGRRLLPPDGAAACCAWAPPQALRPGPCWLPMIQPASSPSSTPATPMTKDSLCIEFR